MSSSLKTLLTFQNNLLFCSRHLASQKPIPHLQWLIITHFFNKHGSGILGVISNHGVVISKNYPGNVVSRNRPKQRTDSPGPSWLTPGSSKSESISIRYPLAYLCCHHIWLPCKESWRSPNQSHFLPASDRLNLKQQLELHLMRSGTWTVVLLALVRRLFQFQSHSRTFCNQLGAWKKSRYACATIFLRHNFVVN